MNCIHCGANLKQDALFCSSCGKAVQQTETIPAQPVHQSETIPAQPVQQSETISAQPVQQSGTIPVQPAPVDEPRKTGIKGLYRKLTKSTPRKILFFGACAAVLLAVAAAILVPILVQNAYDQEVRAMLVKVDEQKKAIASAQDMTGKSIEEYLSAVESAVTAYDFEKELGSLNAKYPGVQKKDAKKLDLEGYAQSNKDFLEALPQYRQVLNKLISIDGEARTSIKGDATMGNILDKAKDLAKRCGDIKEEFLKIPSPAGMEQLTGTMTESIDQLARGFEQYSNYVNSSIDAKVKVDMAAYYTDNALKYLGEAMNSYYFYDTYMAMTKEANDKAKQYLDEAKAKLEQSKTHMKACKESFKIFTDSMKLAQYDFPGMKDSTEPDNTTTDPAVTPL